LLVVVAELGLPFWISRRRFAVSDLPLLTHLRVTVARCDWWIVVSTFQLLIDRMLSPGGEWPVVNLDVLEQFRNYCGLIKDGEVWFSLQENHEEAYRSGLHQLRNCSSDGLACSSLGFFAV
jgi:hypothetical protein